MDTPCILEQVIYLKTLICLKINRLLIVRYSIIIMYVFDIVFSLLSFYYLAYILQLKDITEYIEGL